MAKIKLNLNIDVDARAKLAWLAETEIRSLSSMVEKLVLDAYLERHANFTQTAQITD